MRRLIASARDVAAMAVIPGTAVFADTPRSAPVITLPVTEGHDLRFDHPPLGIDLSRRRITGTVQDALEFLWIRTDDGLKRYDGYRVRDHRHDTEDPNSLPVSYSVSLFEDRSGKLWVAPGRYLEVYDPATGKFTPFPAGLGNADRLDARVGEVNQDRAGTEVELTIPGSAAYGEGEVNGRFGLFRIKAAAEPGKQSET